MFAKMRNGLPRIFRCVSTESSEVREVAAAILKDYLNGHWKTANSNNLIVQKMSGGLSNWLYQITLSSFQNQTDTTDPKTVLLRFHGPIYGKSAFEHIITDSLIFMLMSERSLGPKLHGVFPGGRIEEYIPNSFKDIGDVFESVLMNFYEERPCEVVTAARSLQTNELYNSKISHSIAVKMAHIHSLDVPISKNANSLFDLMSKWLMELQREWDQYEPSDSQLKKLSEKFKSYDLVKEMTWLRNFLSEVNSPVVFCHNDLQEGNILITYDSLNSDEPNLVIIDFEYCSYNYRGFEIANHFLEYMYNYKEKEYPYFKIDSSVYPTIESQVSFIRTYLKNYNRLMESGDKNAVWDSSPEPNDEKSNSGDNKVTKEESSLLAEISNYRLLSHLFWGVWAAAHSRSPIEFGYWDYSLARLEAYFETKEKLLCSEISVAEKSS